MGQRKLLYGGATLCALGLLLPLYLSDDKPNVPKTGASVIEVNDSTSKQSDYRSSFSDNVPASVPGRSLEDRAGIRYAQEGIAPPRSSLSAENEMHQTLHDAMNAAIGAGDYELALLNAEMSLSFDGISDMRRQLSLSHLVSIATILGEQELADMYSNLIDREQAKSYGIATDQVFMHHDYNAAALRRDPSLFDAAAENHPNSSAYFEIGAARTSYENELEWILNEADGLESEAIQDEIDIISVEYADALTDIFHQYANSDQIGQARTAGNRAFFMYARMGLVDNALAISEVLIPLYDPTQAFDAAALDSIYSRLESME